MWKEEEKKKANIPLLTFDHLTALDDVGVGMVDGHVEAEGLEQDVLVADQLLGLRNKGTVSLDCHGRLKK